MRLLLLIAAGAIGSPSLAEPQFVGSWSFSREHCTDPLTITENRIEDSVDLECSLVPPRRQGVAYRADAICMGNPVTFRFKVAEDTLTLLEGIDFGTGLPIELYRCPTD